LRILTFECFETVAVARLRSQQAGDFAESVEWVTLGVTLTKESAVGGLCVSSVDGVAAIERFGSMIDQLNALSSRRNPFLSAAFLLCYALRIEYYTPGREERLYLIWEGGRLIGIAPMRRSLEEVAPALGPLHLRGIRIRVLAPLDTEQPGILSAPEDLPRVAAALIAHICAHEHDWGILEFAGQLPGTSLYAAMHAAGGGKFRSRDIEVAPYTEIPVVWSELTAYFRSLTKKMRSNISRQARRLFANGQIELVLAEGPQAVSAWFDAYCDLDSRSWKYGTESSIQRHPRRVRFYREIAAGRGGMDPSFIGVVLDGVLTAGLLVGSNSGASPERHGAWCLEMAYDESRADLGPGQLLLLLAVGEAIRRGDKFLNFMQNFAYYKHRWGAESIPVVNVQLIRRASLHNVRAMVAELIKKLAARVRRSRDNGAAPIGATSNGPLPNGNAPPPASPDLSRARYITAAALAYDGPGVRRLDRDQSRAHLPFDLE
jgi:Acetyltransferase (GNAT) domain